MARQPIDRWVEQLPREVYASVYDGAKSTHEKRTDVVNEDLGDDLASLRRLAGQIKRHTLDNLDAYLPKAVQALEDHGAQVHFATDGDSACATILDILRTHGCESLVKAKSMATEEIGLVPYLQKNNIRAVETDLGEFIVQIDDDLPSHIVKPIIHKNRRGIAKSFEREGIGAYDEDPKALTMMARRHLRQQYLSADAGMTGANFVSAESGRLVVVTNEGNARFSMAGPRVHIAVVGIEKLVPRDEDLAVFLNLLARSATGQRLTVYTQFLRGPKHPEQQDGPEAMHVVFIDNGRSEILGGPYSEMLKCIRCGGCLNVCPVYRQAGGHGYRTVYPGPMGSVLSPLLAGDGFGALADLPKACSLCGACTEVCPVEIPLADYLVKLRDKAKREGHRAAMVGSPSMVPFGAVASRPATWRRTLTMGAVMNLTPEPLMKLIPSVGAWLDSRTLPPWRGGKFRQWMRERRASALSNARPHETSE